MNFFLRLLYMSNFAFAVGIIVGFATVVTGKLKQGPNSRPQPILTLTSRDYISRDEKLALPLSIKEEAQWSRNSVSHFPVSLPALHRLVIEEHNFYHLLKNRFKPRPQTTTLDKLAHRFIRRYETEALDGIRRWSEITGKDFSVLVTLNHPWLILQMLRRLVYEFQRLYPLLQEKSEALPKFNPRDWPTQQDVHYFSSLLTHLQYFYDYDVNKFGRGIVGKHVATGVNLSSVMAIELGFVAGQQRLYSSSVDWIAFALKEAQKNGGMSVENVTRALEKAIRDHDEHADLLSGEIQSIFSTKIETLDFYDKYRPTLSTVKAEVKRMIIKEGKQNSERNIQSFMHLCTGDSWQSEDERRTLNCWYGNSESSAFSNKKIFSISPYKMELLSRSPRLVKIHEFATPTESLKLRRDSFTCLERWDNPRGDSSKAAATEGSSVMRERAGMNCNLKALNRKYVQNLNRRIQGVTGLPFSNSYNSPIDIEHHLPGGHFQPTRYPNRVPMGQNVAQLDSGVSTFMIFLNTPKVGGRTVFPSLGWSDAPKAGAAMFWHNHFTNGTVDPRLAFGSCPVVLGQKWTATKWI